MVIGALRAKIYIQISQVPFNIDLPEKFPCYFIEEGDQHTDGSQAHIHEVRWDTDMHGPVTRKLVNESHSKYVRFIINFFMFAFSYIE